MPADTVNSPGSAARTFLRLRIAADAAAVASPTGMTTSGEVATIHQKSAPQTGVTLHRAEMQWPDRLSTARLVAKTPQKASDIGSRPRRRVTVSAPVARPCTTRATSSQPTPSAAQNSAMDTASSASAEAITGRRPTWSDSPPTTSSEPSRETRTEGMAR